MDPGSEQMTQWPLWVLAPTALLAAGLVVGCASEPANTAEPVIDTLPNGALLVTGPFNGAWDRGSGVTLREDLRIGARDGDGPEVFQQVWDIGTDEYDRIYVLDRMAKEIRVFDSLGSHVRTFGREGEGPGEFANPFGMTWDDQGNLWVVDVRLARYSVFDTTGAFLRQYPRSVGGYSWPWPGVFDSNGLLLEKSSVSGIDPDPLISFQPNGRLRAVDTFPYALGFDSDRAATAYWDLRDEQRIGAIVGIPYGGGFQSVIDREGGFWMGFSSEYRLTRRDLGADTLLVVTRKVPPSSVSAEEREDAIRGLEEHLEHPKLDLSRIPDNKPYFERLILDEAGRLWVLREAEGDSWLFDVFDRNGVFLGTAPSPVEPQLLPPPLIGEEVMVLVTADSSGVQFVSRLRITRDR